jgi:preprotein translocase subunit SecG
MQNILLVVHLIVAVFLIGVVMLQRSEGGALGIGGGSGNLFSSRGVGNALTRTTAILAACFFLTSIALTMLSTHKTSGSIVDQVPVNSSEVPAASGAAAPASGATGGDALLPKLDTSKPAVPTNQ